VLQHTFGPPLQALDSVRQKAFEPLTATLVSSESGIMVSGVIVQQWQASHAIVCSAIKMRFGVFFQFFGPGTHGFSF
jgi:hypothetical protein